MPITCPECGTISEDTSISCECGQSIWQPMPITPIIDENGTISTDSESYLKQCAGKEITKFASLTTREWNCVCGTRNPRNHKTESDLDACANCRRARGLVIKHCTAFAIGQKVDRLIYTNERISEGGSTTSTKEVLGCLTIAGLGLFLIIGANGSLGYNWVKPSYFLGSLALIAATVTCVYALVAALAEWIACLQALAAAIIVYNIAWDGEHLIWYSLCAGIIVGINTVPLMPYMKWVSPWLKR